MQLIQLSPQQTTLLVFALIALLCLFFIGLVIAAINLLIKKKWPHQCEVTIMRNDGRNRVINDRFMVFKDTDTRTGTKIPVWIIKTRKAKIRIQKPDEKVFDMVGRTQDYCRFVVLPSGEAYAYKPNFDKVDKQIDFDVSNRDALTWHVNEYKKIDEKWAWKNQLQQMLMLISPFILMVMLIIGGFYLNKMTREAQDAATSIASSNVEVARATRDVANMTMQIYNHMPGSSGNPIILPGSGGNP